MPFRKISTDVKLAALELYNRHLLPLDTILDCVGFSESTFWRIKKLFNETGSVEPRPCHTRGRPRLLVRTDLEYLLELIKLRPSWFLDELEHLLSSNRLISVHFTTIHRELERAGISSKKLRHIAKERNEDVRADFVHRMAQYDPVELGFLDEVSKDERMVQRRRGRAKKGRRAVMKGVFVRGRRLSAEGLLTVDGMVACRVVEGSMTRALFLEFLEHSVMPLCSPYPGPLSVLIMDNARIHHGEEILELTARFGVRVRFLPPYSPDLNPIEEAFSKVKHFIRRNEDKFAAAGDGIIFDMYEAMDIVTADDAKGYIRHSGYI